jgi:hypothetical protein
MLRKCFKFIKRNYNQKIDNLIEFEDDGNYRIPSGNQFAQELIKSKEILMKVYILSI